jgi:putative Mg2+ transporter-C (MgtC) family protein
MVQLASAANCRVAMDVTVTFALRDLRAVVADREHLAAAVIGYQTDLPIAKENPNVISDLDVTYRLLTAAILGAVIGANRGRLDWAAGLRTHMLVCVGAALALIVSAYGFDHALKQANVVLDPSRVAAQVISGIGFLGAGTILFLQKEQVIKGLTTAAGLWAVAAVGLASGAGMYVPAFVATFILWAILALLKPIERRFVSPRRKYTSIQIEISHGLALASIESVVADFHAPIERMNLRRDPDGQDQVTIRFATHFPTEKLAQIADACRQVEGAVSVSLSMAGSPTQKTPLA